MKNSNCSNQELNRDEKYDENKQAKRLERRKKNSVILLFVSMRNVKRIIR